MAAKKLKSKVQFAKYAGVTAGAITRALDGVLGEAMVGIKIDCDHAVAVKYVARCHARNAARKERDERNDVVNKVDTVADKYLDMALRDIIDIFGSDVEFVEWLKSAKAIEDLKEKRIKNESSLGNLIPRDYVKTHLFDLVDTVFVRLLNDSPRTISARVLEAFQAGSSRDAVEKLVCDLLSVQLKSLKLRARRALRE